MFEQKIAHHQHSAGLIQMLLRLVFNGANHLRTSARSMSIMGNILPDIDTDVSWHSVRLWAMRLGYYELTRAKEKADDWIWIVDHSIQLSNEKCLVIVGFRLSDYGKACDERAQSKHKPLQHSDLSLISLDIVRQSSGAAVCEQLQKAVAKTGIPRAIIHDHGSELKAGAEQFKMQHSETSSIYDIKHKAALEIKHRLEQDAQWEAFAKTASAIDKRLRQTAYAHLTPPKLRNKARYMNLDTRMEWAQRMLKLMDAANKEDSKVFELHIGELNAYRHDIQRWSEMLAITGYVENFSRRQWLSKGCEAKLSQDLNMALSVQDPDNQALQQSLEDFIQQQSGCCREGEYLPNSSEVLESLFGRQKYLEGEQASRGFSGLILGIGAMVSDLSVSVIKKAMETAPVKQVLEWQKEFLGETLQARRIATNLAAKTEQKAT